MATVKLLDKSEQPELAANEMDSKLAQQMQNILEEAKLPQEPKQPEARQWHYQVPFAGVRYYSF